MGWLRITILAIKLTVWIVHFFTRPGVPPDTTPPSLTCPSDIVQVNDPGWPYATVTWDTPIAVDETDGQITATLVGTQGPGSIFLSGVTYVSYYAQDEAGNYAACSFTVTVHVVDCPMPDPVDNGYYLFTPSGNPRYGTKADFTCYTGYELVPAAGIQGTSLTCLNSGQWSGPNPTCQKTTCPALPAFPDGSVACSDGDYYGSQCLYACDPGYGVPAGQARLRLCAADGTWSGETPTCTDTEGPLLSACPADIFTYTDTLADDTVVTWTPPTATDNKDGVVEVVQVEGPSAGSTLTTGSYLVSYTAVDSTGNQADPCVFNIVVQQLKCAPLYASASESMSCPDGYLAGATCSFSCAPYHDLEGPVSVTCTVVGGVASWDWGGATQPTCKGQQCAPLPAPAHGSLDCDYWLYGQFCQLTCDVGYDVSGQTTLTGGDTGTANTMYVCGADGQWDHYDMPECVATISPLDYRLPVSLSFDSGDCCSSSVQQQIADDLSSMVTADCAGSVQAADVSVVCQGCTPARRRRSVYAADISLDLTTEATSGGTPGYYQAQAALSACYDSLVSALSGGSASLPPLSAISDYSKAVVGLDCGTGFVQSYQTAACVECSPGTFADRQSNTCEWCPLGTYGDTGGAVSCVACPPGQTTTQPGATAADQCLTMCQAGYYSDGGVEPCSPCSQGYYSDQAGSLACTACPINKWTKKRASDALSACQGFDVNLRSGYLSFSAELGTLASDLDVTLKLHLRDGVTTASSVAQLSLSDASGTTHDLVFEPSPSTFVVTVESCRVEGDVSGLVRGSGWAGVLLSWRSGALSLRLDGTPVASAACDLPAFQGPVTASVILGNNQHGPSTSVADKISDFYLFTSSPDLTQLSASAATCGFTPADVAAITWRDVAAADFSSGAAIDYKLSCDDTDECAGAPCGISACADLLGAYACNCVAGMTGDDCQTNVDDCPHNNCQNGGVCVDGLDDYTCSCPAGFSGQFCDIQTIDGGWSDWLVWETCSASCAGGTRTRRRSCNNPAPSAGGLACVGDSEQTEACNTQPCPVCTVLTEPAHSELSCEGPSGPGGDKSCTVTCEEGYDFPLLGTDQYYCGPSTFYRWSFQTADNPSAQLPDCVEMTQPDALTVANELSYPDMPCTASAKHGAKAKAEANVAQLGCVKTGHCTSTVSEGECSSGTVKRSTDQAGMVVRFYLTVNTGVNSTAEVNETLLSVNESASALHDMISDGAFTVLLSNTNYTVGGHQAVGTAVCQPGNTYNAISCLACAAGTYEEDTVCKKCGRGSYQPDLGQTSCLPCPPGLTTLGTGAINASDCLYKCPAGTYQKNGVCELCDVGSYQDAVGQVTCTNCPDGRTTFMVGADNVSLCDVECGRGSYGAGGRCWPCEPGSYQGLEGQTACLNCPSGTTTSGKGAITAASCTAVAPVAECGAGTYQDVSGGACRACAPGSYQERAGQTACLLCPPGQSTPGQGSSSPSECKPPESDGKSGLGWEIFLGVGLPISAVVLLAVFLLKKGAKPKRIVSPREADDTSFPPRYEEAAFDLEMKSPRPASASSTARLITLHGREVVTNAAPSMRTDYPAPVSDA